MYISVRLKEEDWEDVMQALRFNKYYNEGVIAFDKSASNEYLKFLESENLSFKRICNRISSEVKKASSEE